MKTSIFGSKLPHDIRYFWDDFKNIISVGEFWFGLVGSPTQFVRNIKLITNFFFTFPP